MKITIVGLGVIGGSFAMAFKEAGFEDVYAIDLNKESIEKAKDMGIIKDGSDNAREFLKISDLVIICIYPKIIKNFILENKNNFKDGAIVTDVATPSILSTSAPLLSIASITSFNSSCVNPGFITTIISILLLHPLGMLYII